MQSQLTLTQEITVNDEIDRLLLEEILQIVQNTQVLSVVSYWGQHKLNLDKAGELFLKKIILSINSLVKANALRRNFIKIRDYLIEEIKVDPIIVGTSVDILFNKVDAIILIEGYFTQLKTALDLLAQSLKPIYGKEFHTWKTKDNLSGMKIADDLSNKLGEVIRPNAQSIIDLIRIHSESITRIVAHRNDTVHYGKDKKVQGFRYSVQQNKVFPPLILVTDTESAYVDEYMQEVLEYISDFVQEFIITLLSNLLPDMKIAKHPDGQWGWVTQSNRETKGVSSTNNNPQ